MRGSALSQKGAAIANLIAPVDALRRYSMDQGENGPPSGPEILTEEDGVTVKDGLGAV